MDLRNGGVTDTRVLAAIELTPRETFVEETFVDQAYANQALPINCGQTISQPLVVGLMSQALEIGDRHKVLEVGTGSGYQAAILSKLARRVYTVERHRDLLAEAEQRFKVLNLHNITTMVGDGYKGWPGQQPFDRILVTAAARLVPPDLVAQLSDEGGVMVLPVGDVAGLNQEVIRVRKNGKQFTSERLFPVRFVPLVQGVPEVRK
jgi:protein-L-isoaspartate(D-aspartate) O-methyltransferase